MSNILSAAAILRLDAPNHPISLPQPWAVKYIVGDNPDLLVLAELFSLVAAQSVPPQEPNTYIARITCQGHPFLDITFRHADGPQAPAINVQTPGRSADGLESDIRAVETMLAQVSAEQPTSICEPWLTSWYRARKIIQEHQNSHEAARALHPHHPHRKIALNTLQAGITVHDLYQLDQLPVQRAVRLKSEGIVMLDITYDNTLPSISPQGRTGEENTAILSGWDVIAARIVDAIAKHTKTEQDISYSRALQTWKKG